MTPISNGNKRFFSLHALLSTVIVAGALSCSIAQAQDAPPVQPADTLVASASVSPVLLSDVPASSSSDASALPEAPSALLSASTVDLGSQIPSGSNGPEVSPYTKYVPAGSTAPQITAHDKFVMGFRDVVSPFSILAILFSAGYSHVTNGEPNYGTDKGAFGERIGATAIRDTTEDILATSVYAPLLHEDPRYYVEGPQYGFFHRVLYAATRPIITRTDSGRTTINAAQILGDASASAISYTYYPPINRNFRDTVATFGGSLGGDALGDVVSEFSHQVLKSFHLSK